MALEDKNKMAGDTEGPFIQFEDCRHAKDFECKFKDINGKCIYETCVMDNDKPPRTSLWYFRCLICKREDSINPDEMRAPFCHSCIERMNKVEELPHTCRYCGKTINSPAQFMFSGICDECDSYIKGMVNYYRATGHKWWKPL